MRVRVESDGHCASNLGWQVGHKPATSSLSAATPAVFNSSGTCFFIPIILWPYVGCGRLPISQFHGLCTVLNDQISRFQLFASGPSPADPECTQSQHRTERQKRVTLEPNASTNTLQSDAGRAGHFQFFEFQWPSTRKLTFGLFCTRITILHESTSIQSVDTLSPLPSPPSSPTSSSSSSSNSC